MKELQLGKNVRIAVGLPGDDAYAVVNETEHTLNQTKSRDAVQTKSGVRRVFNSYEVEGSFTYLATVDDVTYKLIEYAFENDALIKVYQLNLNGVKNVGDTFEVKYFLAYVETQEATNTVEGQREMSVTLNPDGEVITTTETADAAILALLAGEGSVEYEALELGTPTIPPTTPAG